MDPRLAGVLVAGGQVCTTARLRAIEIDADATERLVRSGELVRLRRGLFAAGETWRSAKPEARLALCTRAVLGERRGAAASHASAAVLHGLPLWGVGLSTVEVICSSPRRRLRGGVRLHPWPDGVEAEVVDGLRVVPLATAVVQVIAEHGHLPGLVSLDGALHAEQVTGAQVEAAGVALGLRGQAAGRLRRVVAEADPECESVGETRTRVLLRDLGLSLRSQVEIFDRRGKIGRVDFLVGERVVVEFDGLVKYEGHEGRRALAAEKAREDRLRAAGYAVVRLVWTDLDQPERVLAMVQQAMARVA